MKPIAQRTDPRSNGDLSSDRQRRPFPLVDCNYQAFSLDRFSGDSTGGGSARSFLNISRDYFQREARQNFLAEVAFFLVLAIILAASFIEGARVIIHFLYLPAA